jgi:uncharacterized membrane protein
MDIESKPSKELLESWHDDPLNWKLGIIYVKKEDARIFVPKRLGIGWTINFGNPRSILVLPALIIFTALVVLITRYLK